MIIGIRELYRTDRPIAKDSADPDWQEPERKRATHDNATLVSSKIDVPGMDIHMPVLDFDVEAHLVPSSTPGHSHLYINHAVPWEKYVTCWRPWPTAASSRRTTSGTPSAASGHVHPVPGCHQGQRVCPDQGDEGQMTLRMLAACESSGRVRDAFAARGWDAWSCDLEPSETPGQHIQGDILSVFEWSTWDLVIAFPPCTDLSLAGAVHWKQKQADGRQQRAADFFMRMWTRLTANACCHRESPGHMQRSTGVRRTRSSSRGGSVIPMPRRPACGCIPSRAGGR